MKQTNRAYDSAIFESKNIETHYIAYEWLLLDKQNSDNLTGEARKLLRDLEWDGDNEDATLEAIKNRMIENALEITVQKQEVSGKCNITGATFLLSTGGPAVRVFASHYDGYETVSNTTLECQDWSTQWEPVTVTDQQDEALEWFVSLFYICEEE